MVRLKNNRANFIWFGLFFSLATMIAGGLLWARENRKELSIIDFETCAKYYPVMESYPEQCMTKSGKRFVNDIGNELSLMGEMMIQNPRPTQTIKSPIVIRGRAVGSWFFEGSFSGEIVDDQGNSLAMFPVTTTGNWMTSQMVDFSARVEFVAKTKKGKLILRSANPSGLPEKGRQLIVPVKFEL